MYITLNISNQDIFYYFIINRYQKYVLCNNDIKPIIKLTVNNKQLFFI